MDIFPREKNMDPWSFNYQITGLCTTPDCESSVGRSYGPAQDALCLVSPGFDLATLGLTWFWPCYRGASGCNN
jgi:hypothetical protein